MTKILLIDDEEIVRAFLSRVLQSAGYDIIEAADGVEGMRLFQEESPALVITDLVMPEKEGLETIAEIRQLNPDTPVIAMTGAMPDRFLRFAKEFGAAQTLGKPFSRMDVLDAVRVALEANNVA